MFPNIDFEFVPPENKRTNGNRPIYNVTWRNKMFSLQRTETTNPTTYEMNIKYTYKKRKQT